MNGEVLVVLIALCLLILLIQLAYYVVLIPSPAYRPLRPQALDRHVGTLLYAGTYVLALLRTPFGIPSYLLKVLVFLCVKRIYRTTGNNYARDAQLAATRAADNTATRDAHDLR
jgi:hypothetical protein